jgi:PncC family amidohydrolase
VEHEIDVICIGTPPDEENAWIFQELLFHGITSFKQIIVEEDPIAFRKVLEKCSERVFCVGNSTSLKEISEEFTRKSILWLPEELQRIRPALHTKVLHFCLVSKEQLKKECLPSSKVRTAFYSWEDKVSTVMTSFSKECLEESAQHIKEKFASYEIPCASGSITLALQEKLVQLGKTVAFAESCTGGLLSQLMTSNPGSSQCFLGSFVTYSNTLKSEILGVREETLRDYGAVSSQTVEEMVDGVLHLTKADFAIAVSGVAGPDGGSESLPVGTVWFAIGEKGKVSDVEVLQVSGDRHNVISIAAHHVLSVLYMKLNKITN